MSLKTRPTWILGLEPKLVHHRQAQKHVGARWIPNKQQALLRRPLHGRTISGAPAACCTLEKWPWTRLAGKIHPQKTSRRPSSHPSEQPPPATTRPYLAPLPLQLSGPMALPHRRLARFPPPAPRVRRRTHRRCPTLPARCSWTATMSS
jgi:hypothetical protein